MGNSITESTKYLGFGFDSIKSFSRARTLEQQSNVKPAVPFFIVSSVKISIACYVDGFKQTDGWIRQGKLRWCWLERGGAANASRISEHGSDLGE